jgi:hypothetical protein
MLAWRSFCIKKSQACAVALAIASTTGLRGIASPAVVMRTGLAVGQMRSTSSPEDNLKLCAQLCADAAGKGAAFLSLPECFEFMGTPGSGDALRFAQPLDGELFNRYRALAEDHGMWLSLGGFHEKSAEDPSKMFNTHVIVDARGEIVAAYRKLHLFDVDYDGGFRESNSTHSGQVLLDPRICICLLVILPFRCAGGTSGDGNPCGQRRRCDMLRHSLPRALYRSARRGILPSPTELVLPPERNSCRPGAQLAIEVSTT